MKKKIKDLTITECKRICDKCKDCSLCPLWNVICEESSFYYSFNDNYEEESFEKEVEVNE